MGNIAPATSLQPENGWNPGAFAAGLTDPGHPAPAGLHGLNGGPAVKRYAVYRNNVVHSLIEAMGDIFPAVRALAGPQRFAHVARLYLDRHPPSSKLLFEYGRHFGDFLDDFEPARVEMPWLADLARLERAWLDAYHAADVAPLDPSALSTIPPHGLGGIMFDPHPAAQMLCSPWPVLPLFLQARANGPEIVPSLTGNLGALVTRPALNVLVHPLTDEQSAFAGHLLSGSTLAEATDAAFAPEDAAALMPPALSILIAAGAFAACRIS